MILTLDTDNILLQTAVVLLLSFIISILAEVILAIDLVGRIWISPFAVVRYLTIALLHVINIAELTIYMAVRLSIKVLEFFFCNNRSLRAKQRNATSYEEWLSCAKQLDKATGRTLWKHDLEDWTAEHYSWSYIDEMMQNLKLSRMEGDVMMAAALLSLCLRKNVVGTFNSELYSYHHTGEPKKIVKEFVQEIVTTLKWATKASATPHEKLIMKKLLARAETTYGRCALCLSGGAMMGNYHLGIVEAYKKEGILTKIMSGSSMGSIICAFVCTRTDEEFEHDMKPEVLQPRLNVTDTPWSERIQNLIKTGAMWKRDVWLEGAKWFTCGEMTFLEAFQKTGRTLNISLSATSHASPPILLNHITAPDILIYSAVVASASAPSFLPPAYLIAKNPDGTKEILKEEYFDGSMEQDIPKEAMQEQLNCSFFVVVQANPQLVPFQFFPNGSPGNPPMWKDYPNGGNLLSGLELYLKMDMKNRLRFLTAGIQRGGLATVFTQNFGGNVNICIPFEIQDFPKVLEQPSMDDLHRNIQGGNYAAYGSVAMIKLYHEISRTIDECRKDIGMTHGHGFANEVERLVRPYMFGRSSVVDHKEQVLAHHTSKRKSLLNFLTASFKKGGNGFLDEDIEVDPNVASYLKEKSFRSLDKDTSQQSMEADRIFGSTSK